MMIVTVDLYDSYSNKYSLNDWARFDELIGIAKAMGHTWKSTEYQGYSIGWLVFDNADDAVLFKLTYL